MAVRPVRRVGIVSPRPFELCVGKAQSPGDVVEADLVSPAPFADFLPPGLVERAKVLGVATNDHAGFDEPMLRWVARVTVTLDLCPNNVRVIQPVVDARLGL